MDRREANRAVLAETSSIQDKTKDSTIRTQQKVAEIEDMGTTTLDQLRRQGQQMVNTICIPSFIVIVIFFLSSSFYKYHRMKFK